MQTADSLSAAASDAAIDVQSALGEAWGKVAGWVEGLVASLPNVLAALVVLFVFWGLGRLIRWPVKRLAGRFTRAPEVTRLLASTVQLLVLGLGLVLALGVLNLDRTVTSLLAGAGILGLALGFAFQDTAANLIAGVILNVRDQFREGELIESGDYMGVVERVQLRATVVRAFTGQRVLIPNAQVFKKPIVNYTQSGRRRVDIAVGVSYGDDLERARRVATEAVRDVPGRDESRDIEVFYEEFGGSSIKFQLHFWIPFVATQTDYLHARSEAIIRIKKAFDEAGITIPFPIRTLDFAGGDAGGQGLTTALTEAGLGGGPGDRR